MRFTTSRLTVRDWCADLDGAARAQLEHEVSGLLTPAVLAPLPPAVRDLEQGVSGWIDRQARMAQGLVIRHREDARFVGLVLIYEADAGELLLGYLLAERHWG